MSRHTLVRKLVVWKLFVWKCTSYPGFAEQPVQPPSVLLIERTCNNQKCLTLDLRHMACPYHCLMERRNLLREVDINALSAAELLYV